MGRHDEADLHANAARGHEEDARYHGGEARRHGRGFAGMDPERQREIASMGGRASHGGGGRDEDYETRGGRSQDRPRDERGELEPRSSSRERDDEYESRGGSQERPRHERGEVEPTRSAARGRGEEGGGRNGSSGRSRNERGELDERR